VTAGVHEYLTIMSSDEPDLPRRTSIDADDPRVIWAAERTLLAWIRTGLAMMGFGFLVARFGLFLRELAAVKGNHLGDVKPGLSLWIGTGLVLLGVAVNLLAAWQHWRIERELYPSAQRRWPRIALALAVAVLLGAIGIAMAVYLVAID
jgi:putative membrane protein